VAADHPPGQGTSETADDQEHDEFHDFLLPMNVGTEAFVPVSI
jgi:hypothetical protein